MKAATQHSFQGPHMTGSRMVQIVTRGDDGRAVSVQDFPCRDKAEALAIAKREGAVFTC